MSRNHKGISDNQPENYNNSNNNIDQRRQLSIRNPILSNYFERNKRIENEGYIDSIKM